MERAGALLEMLEPTSSLVEQHVRNIIVELVELVVELVARRGVRLRRVSVLRVCHTWSMGDRARVDGSHHAGRWKRLW